MGAVEASMVKLSLISLLGIGGAVIWIAWIKWRKEIGEAILARDGMRWEER